MWDVLRFAEQMAYDCIVVENVVEATKWIFWATWRKGLDDLGYEVRILSHNSMHHGVPQSRDRIYVVCWRKGLKPDLELELAAWCPRCDAERTVRQAWKNGRTVGRYRQQWIWACTTCHGPCEPSTEAAATIIDWEVDCPRIGDRDRPLAPATRKRILGGLQRYGWAPITTSGGGNVWENKPGMRARSINDPVPTQCTMPQTAVALNPDDREALANGFLFQTAHGGRVTDLEAPHPTVCASDDRQALVLANNFANVPTAVEDPLPTATTGNRHGLIVPLRTNGEARATTEVVPTVTAGGNHHGLLMRNNTGGPEMVTPLEEPARSMTTKGHQSLLVPYNGTGQARPVDEPMGTQPTRDRFALLDTERVVDDCGFRMLEPYEIAAAMAFPRGYIPRDLPKRDQVKLAGNAVTPPVMTWITGRLLQALEAAA